MKKADPLWEEWEQGLEDWIESQDWDDGLDDWDDGLDDGDEPYDEYGVAKQGNDDAILYQRLAKLLSK